MDETGDPKKGGVPAGWVAGDEVYGGGPHLSAELERRQTGYVLAVPRKRPIPTRAGVFSGSATWPTACRNEPGSG